MAQQAKPDLPVGDDGAAARGIALLLRSAMRDGVAAMVKGRSSCAARRTRRRRVPPAAISHHSTEDLAGDRVEPALGKQRLLRANRARRVERADAAGARTSVSTPFTGR